MLNTIEAMLADQLERIERCQAPKGSNAILDYINEINGSLPKHH